jgi:hypothetical protein
LVAVIAAVVVVLILVREVRRLVRNRAGWSRAAAGAVSLTLRGEAVAKQRTVAGRPMRTVLVHHRGEPRYLHLLFAKDAPADTMRQGLVTVEFFATDDAEGPARLLLADGRTLWAFTSRLGDQLPADDPRATRRWSTRSTDDGAAMMAPTAVVGNGPQDEDRERDAAGRDDGPDTGSGDSAGTDDSVWSGSDGWTGGGSWSGDPTWSSSDGGSTGGTGDGGGGGWSGGGWSGGDSGGGGGDSGGGSS